jgi:type IV fimbrial biogenesis protein FimT
MRKDVSGEHGPHMKVSAGFTLVELMVVITIVAMLLALGVPSYRYVTNSNRVSAEVNTLLGDLMFARSEAIKEGATVTVCPIPNPPANPPICNPGSTEWDHGWIVTSPTVTPNVLRIQQAFANTTDSFLSNGGQTSITFDRYGFANATPALTNAGATIILKTTPATATAWIRCVEIGRGGMIETARYKQDANCQ